MWEAMTVLVNSYYDQSIWYDNWFQWKNGETEFFTQSNKWSMPLVVLGKPPNYGFQMQTLSMKKPKSNEFDHIRLYCPPGSSRSISLRYPIQISTLW